MATAPFYSHIALMANNQISFKMKFFSKFQKKKNEVLAVVGYRKECLKALVEMQSFL